jgi:hypothetical protein
MATKKASRKTEREGGRKRGVNEGKVKVERARNMTHRSRRSRATSKKGEEMEDIRNWRSSKESLDLPYSGMMDENIQA